MSAASLPLTVAAAWAFAVTLAVAAAGRSIGARARAVAALRPGGASVDGTLDASATRRTVPTWVGLAVLSLVSRCIRSRSGLSIRPARSDERLAARVGGAVLGGLPVLAVAPRFAPIAVLVGVAWPSVRERKARRASTDALARALPETADLLVLAVGAGCNIPLALAAVARRADGPVASAVREALDEVAAGRRLADALHDLPARHGEVLRPLTAALESSERYGTPLLTTLERLAAEVRLARRRRAEEVARRLPVKLLFPLVTCTLPAFGLLTVAPLLASALHALRLDA